MRKLDDTKDDEVKPEYEAYYDGESKSYWLKTEGGKFIECNKDILKNHLRCIGYSATADNGAPSEIDRELNYLFHHRNLLYAGPLAGHNAGAIKVGSETVLVTSSPELVKPRAGEWPKLEKFISGLLGDQDVYLYGWLKSAYESLRDHTFRPGQALAFAGPPGCGKTLLQQIIGCFLGGRQSNPFRYFSGETTFNAELFRCEHLAVGDETVKTNIDARRTFGAKLKNVAAEPWHSCHKKGKTAFDLRPFWRTTISLNNDGQNVMVLPPMDGSLMDKITLFQCTKDPDLLGGAKAHAGFKESLVAELPMLINWLLEIEIPEHLVDDRYGIVAFQHPELLEALEEHSPEEKLWTLVLESILTGDKNEMVTTAAKLEDSIIASHDHQGKRLFNYSTACGVMLKRLADKRDGRVERALTRSLWRLTRRAADDAWDDHQSQIA